MRPVRKIMSRFLEWFHEEPEIYEALRKFFSSEPGIVLDQRMARLLDMLSENSQFNFDMFKHECLELYNKERANVKQVLKYVEGNISLSVDVISSGKVDSKNGSEYMCLTAHIIDHEWTLRRFILDFSPLEGDGKDSPGGIILRSLREWEIEDKIWTITAVNGSFYDDIFEAVKVLNGKLYRVNCCADIVKTLVVKDAYESRTEILDKITEILDNNEDVNSLKDSLSTWKNKNIHLNDALKEGFEGISYDDKRKVSEVCKLVDKVYDLVCPLFGNGYQSANVFLCNLHEVQFYLNKIVIPSNRFAKDVAENMLRTLDKYVKDTYFLLATASLLDPRSKLKYVSFSVDTLNYTDFSEFNLFLSELLQALYSRKENFSGCMLLQEFTLRNHSRAVESELLSYLVEPILAWSSDFSVLTWWKVQGSSKYPMLSRMAREVLAIPFTIAVGDKALMIEQREVDSCIASVDPEMAKAFMCIRSWLLNQNSALSSSS